MRGILPSAIHDLYNRFRALILSSQSPLSTDYRPYLLYPCHVPFNHVPGASDLLTSRLILAGNQQELAQMLGRGKIIGCPLCAHMGKRRTWIEIFYAPQSTTEVQANAFHLSQCHGFFLRTIRYSPAKCACSKTEWRGQARASAARVVPSFFYSYGYLVLVAAPLEN